MDALNSKKDNGRDFLLPKYCWKCKVL